MIGLLLGPPGGGKSYEAVVYHLLPALEAGRRVVTNLPLHMHEISKIVPAAPSLIELRHTSRVVGRRPFSVIEDYGDDWRDPLTGRGPLYLIDEAHKAVPRVLPVALDLHEKRAYVEAKKVVDEWFAEHRHEGTDVILMTQSYGKLSKDIVDQVQVVYRLKKMTIFGDSKRYLRKVQDGVRGAVLSEAERVYQSCFFPLYKSHTRSVAAVIESDALQITPAHLKWKRASYVFMIGGSIWLAWSIYGFFSPAEAKEAPQLEGGARTEEHAVTPPVGEPPSATHPTPQQQPSHLQPQQPQVTPPPQPIPTGPVDSKTMRLVGIIAMPGGKAHAMIHTEDSDRRVSLNDCSSKWPEGWTCTVDGQRVTSWTGPDPSSEGSSMFTSLSPSSGG